jgi:hypothetical protein
MDLPSWSTSQGNEAFSRTREPQGIIATTPIDEKPGGETASQYSVKGPAMDVTPASDENIQAGGRDQERGGEKGKDMGEGTDGLKKEDPFTKMLLRHILNPAQPLPLPTAPGAPYFSRKNISAFLDTMEDLFEICGVPAK